MLEEAKDWRGALNALLDEVHTAYGELQDCALALRRALLQGPLPEVQARVEEHQSRLTGLSRLIRRAQSQCRDHGLLPADAEFTLRRLAAVESVSRDEQLREKIDQLIGLVARTAQEMAHNRYLIGRLSQWSETELRLVFDALLQSPGYQESGRRSPGAAEATLFDRRG
ncbi:MAG: flagellar export chaperone FlgN [Candidatus Eisenbacteria bacterium]